ncbi:MAG: hypothetical protein JSV80_03625 [Acidobacteriota bacterium]|nr:MAG: hypothetical protein JSV80_03625 [Acidobacteriota bacterium]
MPIPHRFSSERTLIVHNPLAGRPRGRARARTLAGRLASGGYRVVTTAAPRQTIDLAQAARRESYTAAIVLGGDGTLLELIKKLPAELAIGQFPVGTVNLLARSLHIPRKTAPWLRMLDAGRTAPVYFGRCNGRPFASVASVGYDAEVVARVNPTLKRWIQEGAYAVEAVRGLMHCSPRRFFVQADGKKWTGEAISILAGRGPYFGGSRRIFPGADPRQARLSVLVLAGGRRRHVLRYAIGLLSGRLPQMRGVESFDASRVKIDSEPPVAAELDGDAAGSTPVVLELEPQPRVVLVPE